MSFLRQFFIYGLGGAASRLAAVVLVPLYTRTLAVADYGRLEVLLAIHALLLIFAGMQLESSVARDYYQAQSRGESPHLARATLWLTLCGTAAATLAVGGAWVLGRLPGEFSGRTMALLLALTLPAQLLGVQLVMLRFAGRPLRFALLSFCDLALSALASVGFIVGLHGGIDGALAGMLVGKTACMLAAWRATFGNPLPAAVDRGRVRRLLAYGIPSIPAVLIGWMQNAGSRLLLAMALTLSDVAIGGVAIKVAALYGFLVYSFRLAWEPFSIGKIDKMSEDPRVFRRTLDWYVAAMFPAAGIASVAGPQIVRLLAPPAYWVSGTIAVLFVMGQFWVGMINLMVIGVHGSRRTSLLLPVYGWGAAVQVAALFALAPIAGVAAAGIGFLAGALLSAFLARHYSNRHFSTGFSLRTPAWTAFGSVAFAAGWWLLSRHFLDARAGSGPSAWVLAAAGLALLLAVTALMALNAFERGRAPEMWAEAGLILRRARTSG